MKLPLVGLCGLLLWRAAATLPPETADRIVIHKYKRELVLLQRGRVLRLFRVALGSSPVGPKTRQGDGKTPEGLYRIAGRNERSAFHRALRISYPNDADRARAQRLGVNPGGDIMIHGLPNGKGFVGKAHRLIDWTAGCIAVTDEEIEQIWHLVPDGTVVEILP
jgi:murein L,D-transpeptidase YafK